MIRKELRRLREAEIASGLGGTKAFPDGFLVFCASLIRGSAGCSDRYTIWRM